VPKSPRSSPIPHHKRQRFSSMRDSRTPEIVSTVSTLPFVAAAAAAFTAFAVTTGTTTNHPTTRTSSPSRSISPALSSVSRAHSPVHHNNNKSADREIQRERESEASSVRSCSDQQRKSCAAMSTDDGAANHNCNDNSNNGNVTISEHDRARPSRRRARSSATKETSSSTSTVFSVVYDIACCDGPVRFHRVLNENYSSTTHGLGPQIRPQRNCPLTEGEDLSSENDENGGPATRENSLARSPSDSSNDGSNSNNGGCYTCGYCKHTFKSQYCYRKHAKRHLLPTRINETTGRGLDHSARQDTVRSRREVRLLDLNVQYYPCKICGCKFPSYYFVHKHRKLCHANEEERQSADTSVATSALSHDADTSSTPDAP